MDLECCLLKAYIRNIAYYLPEKTEENPDGRLRKKTGIKCRHICADEEVASDLAVCAAERLFSQGISRDEVEYLIFCTQSPDYYLPTTEKLLETYIEIDEKQVKGTSLEKTKKDIDDAIDKIIDSFEGLLDKFYQQKELDIATDISAMEILMKQDGLIE